MTHSPAQDADFSYTVFGWNIDVPPSPPAGPGQFVPSPIPGNVLETATSQQIPPQAIDFTTATPSSTEYLSLLDSQGFSFDTDHWELTEAGAFADFGVEMGSPTALALTLTMAAALDKHGQGQGPISIYVNGEQVVHRYTDNNANWHEVPFNLEGSNFVAGSNTVRVRMSKVAKKQVWIQSVGVSTEDVPVSASWFWSQVQAGQVPAGVTATPELSVTTGNQTSDADTQTFAESIGVTAGASGGFLGPISAQLTASFTATQSTTHTVTVTESDTTSLAENIPAPADQSVTYQVWQLGITYAAAEGSSTLTQLLGPAHGPVIVCQYPDNGIELVTG